MLLQYAVDGPECCYRTCVSVRVDGNRLDNFTEVASVEGLKDGTTIELVEGECQVAHGGGGMKGKESKYELEEQQFPCLFHVLSKLLLIWVEKEKAGFVV